MCGNCSNGEQCHHVDGTCPHWCDAGMYGDKCDKGNMRIKFSFNIINIQFFLFKPFSTQNPNCNFYNTLTFKYQFDNIDLNETLSRQVFQYIQWHNYVIRCFDAHTSRPVIDYHEMEKSYQTGNLFLKFFRLVSWIAKINGFSICYEEFFLKRHKLRFLLLSPIGKRVGSFIWTNLIPFFCQENIAFEKWRKTLNCHYIIYIKITLKQPTLIFKIFPSECISIV